MYVQISTKGKQKKKRIKSHNLTSGYGLCVHIYGLLKGGYGELYKKMQGGINSATLSWIRENVAILLHPPNISIIYRPYVGE